MKSTTIFSLAFLMTIQTFAATSVTGPACDPGQIKTYTVESQNPEKNPAKIFIREQTVAPTSMRYYQVVYCETSPEDCKPLGTPGRFYSENQLLQLNTNGFNSLIGGGVGSVAAIGLSWGTIILVSFVVPVGPVVGTVALFATIAGTYVGAYKIGEKVDQYFSVIPEAVASNGVCSEKRSKIVVRNIEATAKAIDRRLLKIN